MRRNRNAKIVVTLGPASGTPGMIRKLAHAGADVFRLNFSHGLREEHAERVKTIRALEEGQGRPTVVLQDLQGPKFRIGEFADGFAELRNGAPFRLEADGGPGTARHAPLPHPEVFDAVLPGSAILLDDGRVRLRVVSKGSRHADCIVEAGGRLSDHKGVNLPGVVVPTTPLTPKDVSDLEYGKTLGVDWVALSFVQHPRDVRQARELAGDSCKLMVKVEKPTVLEHIDEVVGLADGVMVARGDLGVELAPEEVPGRQKELVRLCRLAGKPVVVATQMLESMVHAATPTRAEASDVATAIYDGADAVMLSAESAVGLHPVEAVAMMNRIIERTERERSYRPIIDALHPPLQPIAEDAISAAVSQIARTMSATVIVTYTASGSTAARMARERPEAPILTLTNSLETARRTQIFWGTHCVYAENVTTFGAAVGAACAIARSEGFASPGDRLVITAGVPFGKSGTTNTLRIATIERD